MGAQKLAAVALIFAALYGSPTFAQARSLPETERVALLKAHGSFALCNYVDDQRKDEDETSPFTYLYQQQIFYAAGLKHNVPPTEIAAKIQRIWSKLEDALSCDTSTFDVQNGNILKFAVSAGFDSFVHDVTHK